MQQVAGEQGPGEAGGLAFVFARPQCGQDAAAFDETVAPRTVEGTQDARPTPGGGQRDGVGVHRIDIAGAGEDERRGVDIGGDGFGAGRGGGREEGGDRADTPLRRRDDGRARAHAVSGERQTVRVHADRAVTEPDTGTDIEGGEQIGRQPQM